MKRYDTVIFDLDGTLLNTLEDLAISINHALEECGLPVRTMDEVRRFVGTGARELARKACGEQADQTDRVLAGFHAYYGAHSEDHTGPYPGVLALMQRLQEAGVKQAVISNKPDPQVKSLCRTHFGPWLTLAAGDREGVKRKPEPDAVLAAMAEMNAVPGRTLYVGDSDVDVLTARNAKIDCAAVTWGFRSVEELRAAGAVTFADTAEELEKLILG